MRDSLSADYRKYVEHLYDEYKNMMYRTAMGIVKDQAQAEDIVQFAFVRIIRHIEKLRNLSGDEVRGYITLIIRNLAVDNLRKRRKENVVPIESVQYPAEGKDSLEDVAMANLELGRVKLNLKIMDEKYSLPLIMKYSLGFSHSEIAEILGISVENVKVRCHRGKRMLMDAVGREAAE